MYDFQTDLDTRLEEGRKTGCFACAAGAVGVKDRLLAQACTGQAPEPGGAPVDEWTLFDMASLSKILGPTMIGLRAIEEGSLSLSEQVGDFFPQAPTEKQNITVHMLMTHTAGFAPSFRLDQMGITPEEAVDAILRVPLWAQPGEKPIYSCMGYILFAKMLEKRFGKPLNELAKERVFDPLGMEHTGYCPPSSAQCAATEVDAETGRPWIGVVHDENARFLRGVSGNAGVFMPLSDGIRFASMLGQMGAGYLKRETMEKAIHNYTPGMDAHRGLGFQLAGTECCFFSSEVPDRCFGHTGFTGTSMMVEPETGFWVLLLSNRVYPTRQSDALFPFRRGLHAHFWKKFAQND